MARKTETKTAAAKKGTTTTRGTKKAASGASIPEDQHAKAAYYNWINRGAPLWDDQSDWFSVTR